MTTIIETIAKGIKHWYLPMIIGILFIILGIYVFRVPLDTYVTLSYIFSITFIVSGISDIIFSISNREYIKSWIWHLIGGIISLLIGIYLVMNPDISLNILPFVVGFTLLFRSAQNLGIAFELKSYGILNWGNLAIVSVVGIFLSFGLISHPILTGLSLVTITALLLIISGVYGIVLSLDLKKIKDLPEKLSNELNDKIESLNNEIKSSLKK